MDQSVIISIVESRFVCALTDNHHNLLTYSKMITELRSVVLFHVSGCRNARSHESQRRGSRFRSRREIPANSNHSRNRLGRSLSFSSSTPLPLETVASSRFRAAWKRTRRAAFAEEVKVNQSPGSSQHEKNREDREYNGQGCGSE